MPNSLDGKSYCATQFAGAGNYVLMPLSMGVGSANDPALSPVMLAAGTQFEAINWVRGVTQPALDFIGPAMSTWFNATNLTRAFARSATTGQLSNDMGPASWRIGSGVESDEVKDSCPLSYWGGLVLAGGPPGAGVPVVARIPILGAGNPTTYPNFASNVDAPPYGMSNMFLTEGINFNSTLTEVLGWVLTLNNNLTPDLAQAQTPRAATALQYVQAYATAGAIGASLSLIQKAGATVVDNSSPAATNTIDIWLVDIAGTTTVKFRFYGIKPPKGAVVSGGLTQITRNYVGMAVSGHSKIEIS